MQHTLPTAANCYCHPVEILGCGSSVDHHLKGRKDVQSDARDLDLLVNRLNYIPKNQVINQKTILNPTIFGGCRDFQMKISLFSTKTLQATVKFHASDPKALCGSARFL